MTDSLFAVDISTMLIVMLTSNLLMATVLWFAFAGRFRDGLAKWTTSLGVQALAWLMFAGRGHFSDLISITAANGLLALAWSLQFAAVIEFRRRPLPHWLLWAPTAATFVLFMLLLDHFQLRLIVSSGLFSAANVLLAAVLLRIPSHPNLRAHQLLAGCYLFVALALIARGIGAWLEPGAFSTTLTPNFLHSVLYLGSYALIVAGSLAFLLMHKERSDEETTRLATTDPLTGVFNRRTFIELAEQEFARARRTDTALSLMMLDLDHFKRVNDTYGHLVGDQVLVSFTNLLRDCVRRGDLVVRYGGEEFCVLLPATPLAAATALAERIRNATTSIPPTSLPFRITTSIGLTTYAGGEHTVLGDLLARADEALYRAKDEGRDRVIALSLIDRGTAEQGALPLENTG
ncbi:MAG: GGDEF domain-containing protein [Pseudomonadota bacterium]